MKKHDYILILLFTLLNSVVVFARTNDSMSVKPVHEKDSTAIKQKIATKIVHTDLANLEEAVRKLSGQNSNEGMLPASTKQFRSFPSLATYTANSLGGGNDDLAEFNEVNLEKWFGKNANANKNPTELDRQTEELYNAAEEIFNEIEEHGNFISLITGNKLIELPVGLKKRLGGGKDATGNPTASESQTSITIGIIKAKIFPEYSELDLKNMYFTPKKGSFNVLNVSSDYVSDTNWGKFFWENYNKVFLQNAINRGDKIWAATNPMNLDLIFTTGNKPSGISSFQELSNYLKTLPENIIHSKLTGYGKEVRLLSKNNYQYNSTIKQFIK